MDRFLILFFIIITAFSAAFVFSYFFVKPVANAPVACTMEAKLCPDGSYVGRTGPNCEFTECPSINQGIKGVALLGPFCPVERFPPDPNCADRPYQTSLVAISQNQLQLSFEFSSDSDGKFSIDLPVGSYVIQSSANAGIFSSCQSNGTINVVKGQYTKITLNCDTGIR